MLISEDIKAEKHSSYIPTAFLNSKIGQWSLCQNSSNLVRKNLFSFRPGYWNVVIWFHFDAWCFVSFSWVLCFWLEQGGHSKAVTHSHRAPQQLPPGSPSKHLHTQHLHSVLPELRDKGWFMPPIPLCICVSRICKELKIIYKNRNLK